jgi:hypothetical protein
VYKSVKHFITQKKSGQVLVAPDRHIQRKDALSMNTPILQQSADVVTRSIAYTFGQRDAQEGQVFCPEMVFLQRAQQVEYAKGYESVSGPTVATVQFTGSVIPAPVVTPNYKVNDRERVRRTDSNVERIFQANAARDRRIARAAEETAAFLGGMFAGDIVFA